MKSSKLSVVVYRAASGSPSWMWAIRANCAGEATEVAHSITSPYSARAWHPSRLEALDAANAARDRMAYDFRIAALMLANVAQATAELAIL